MAETEIAVTLVAPHPYTDLSVAYCALVNATAAATLAEATMKEAERMMLETAAGRAYLAAKAAYERAEEERCQEDCEVRLAAEACYKQDGNKHPHLRVDIQARTEMAIVEEKLPEGGLYAWAQAHRDLGLIIAPKVDMRKLEKYARAVKEVAPLEFVTWVEKPVVAISLLED